MALAALACHRLGGEAWETFRAGLLETLGKQPLPGSVVLLVNRLSGSNLPTLLSKAER